MGILDWAKRKLSRDKPSYDVKIPTTKERAAGMRYEDSTLVTSGGKLIGTYQTGGSGGRGAVVSPTRVNFEAEKKRQEAIKQAEAKERARLEAIKVAQDKARITAEKLSATRTQEALREKTPIEQMRQTGQERIDRQREQAETERRRIRQERVDILREGGQQRVQEFTQKETGHKVEHTTTTGAGGSRVFEVKDLETGKTTIRTYDRPRGGGKVQQTGGIVINGDIEPTPEEGIITASKDIFFKDVPDRTGQIYDPKSKMYLASAYGLGAGGTALYSPPTMEEQALIDKPAVEKIKDIYFKYETKLRDIPIIKKTREKILSSETFKDWQSMEILPPIQDRPEPTGAEKIAQTFTTPSGVKSMFDWGAEQTLKGGELLATGTEKILTKTGLVSPESKLFTTPSPISRETAKEFIAGAYLFSGFAPLMKTGTAQRMESEYIFDYAKGKYVKKAKIKDILEEPKVEITGKTVKIKDLTYTDKANRIKDLLRDAKTPEARKLVIKSAEESYGKEFVKDFASQELGIVSVVKVTPPKADTFYNVQIGTEMKHIGQVGTVATTIDKGGLDASKVGQVQWLGEEVKQDTKQAQSVRQIQFLKFAQPQKSRQATAQISKQQTKQETKQVLLLKTSQLTKQTTKQIQRPVTETLLRTITKPQPPKPPKPTPIKPVIFPSFAKRILKKIEKEPEMFSVFGRRFGKDIKLLETKDKIKAEKKLKSFLETTLGRSGLIKKNGKIMGFEEMSLFGTRKFRRAKKDKGRVVQKAQFSLGTGSEVSEIQYFKKKSKGKTSKGKRKSSFFDWL